MKRRKWVLISLALLAPCGWIWWATRERVPFEFMGSARLLRRASFEFGNQPELFVKVYEVDGTVEELAERARSELNTRKGWTRQRFTDGPNTPLYEYRQHDLSVIILSTKPEVTIRIQRYASWTDRLRSRFNF